jgi:hypothetical protein
MDRDWQDLKKRKGIVGLDRKIPIRGLSAVAPTDPAHFARHPLLILEAPNVLDDGVRKHDVKLPIGRLRHGAAITG